MTPEAQKPAWWDALPEAFRSRAQLVNIREWPVSQNVQSLQRRYEARFGIDKVSARIPPVNWQRADFCNRLVSRDQPSGLVDIGSGLGEFVNLYANANPRSDVTSVDITDYNLWYDDSNRIERINISLFDLGTSRQWDVVTCFEVIEHLPPALLAKSVEVLRALARRTLYVSVPFLEPLPLYKGHYSRFDEQLLASLFPDANYIILNKGGNKPGKVLAWILCELACA
jgi:2-polyprenyl-3-methyl-5-hydroxy-6-metoxy-1,4-benzoquinol methylase